MPVPVPAQKPARASLEVLFRGYVSNRAALEATLGVRGDLGDLLAAAYRKWAEALHVHVLGAYSLVIYDRHAGRGVATHDAMGIGPLFYGRAGGRLMFATDLAELAGHGCDVRLDDDYFADYIACGYVRTARTPYLGIRRLLPGETMVLQPGFERQLQTWAPADIAPLRLADTQAYIDALRALLHEAVASAIGTDGGTWVALSGGLDSSTVAVMAAGIEGRNVGAYSLVVPDYPEADESRWIRSVIARTGMDWHSVDVASVLPFSALPERPMAEPSTSVIATAQTSHLRRMMDAHGVTTILTGDGGDEILGARGGPIPTHLADPLFQGDVFGALRGVRAWGRESADRRPLTYWLSRALLAPSVAHLNGRASLDDRQVTPPTWLSPAYVSHADLQRRERRRYGPKCRTPGAQRMWQSLWQAALSMSLSDATKHETRYPLLHRPLVEFMQAIPWSEKLRPGCDRLLQRRSLKGVLPDDVRLRNSKAMGTWPFVEGLARSAAWQDYLCDSPCVVEAGYTSTDGWRQAVAQAASGQTSGDRYFLTMVAIEAWLKSRR